MMVQVSRCRCHSRTPRGVLVGLPTGRRLLERGAVASVAPSGPSLGVVPRAASDDILATGTDGAATHRDKTDKITGPEIRMAVVICEKVVCGGVEVHGLGMRLRKDLRRLTFKPRRRKFSSARCWNQGHQTGKARKRRHQATTRDMRNGDSPFFHGPGLGEPIARFPI